MTAIRKQSGATLIVVLVILIAMTFLGLGGLSDSNLQLAMVRNSQLQTGVYTAALTEINAQIDLINSNNDIPGSQDPTIIAIVTNGTVAANGTDRTSAPARLLDGVVGADIAHYNATVGLTELDFANVKPAPGFSSGPGQTIKLLQLEIASSATITASGTNSNQTQGFNYLSAN